MIVDLKKIFSSESQIGRFEYFKQFVLITPTTSLLIYVLIWLKPHTLLTIPLTLFIILFLLFTLSLSIWFLYKRFYNILDNRKVSIVACTISCILSLVNLFAIIINLILMFVPGKKISDKVISNYLCIIMLPIFFLINICGVLNCTERVLSKSMADTLQIGDRVFCNKLVSNYNRGDIVVHKAIYNKGVIYVMKNPFFIRRIIALPNEKVDIVTDSDNVEHVYVNDKLLKEDYVLNNANGINVSNKNLHIIVPKDSYYVMCDNRGFYFDSRKYGPIHKSILKGRISHVFLPFNRRQVFDTPQYNTKTNDL